MFLHSYFSLKYGILSPEELVQWADAAAYPKVVLADINSSTAILSFVRSAQQKNLPVAAGIDFRNGMDCCYIILAKNNKGFQQANQFLSEHLHEGSSFPDRAPNLPDCSVLYPLEKAPETLAENEYIGIRSSQLNRLKIQVRKFPPDKLLAWEPMSFRNKRDFNTHRLLRAIDNNVLLSKLSVDEQANENEKLIPYADLKTRFADFPELLENSLKLIDSCNIHFEFGENASPQNKAFFTSSKEQDLLFLKNLVAGNVQYRYRHLNSRISARIDMEIDIIAQKDYLSYFLIAWDITSYARKRGFFYVGRGSGANSIVAYILRITDVDPLELDLYFERFINLYRKNPPDFDIDFSWKDRDEITNYIFKRYKNAALLCTYSTFQFRAAVRELGKVFGMPKSEIDVLTRDKVNPEKLDTISTLILKYSRYIHGMPSHLSVHAGGIVISEKPLTYYSATFMPQKGFPTTQFSMLEAEDVGLYKFDILSQRGLSKIHECVAIAAYNQPENPVHDIHDIPYFKEDEKIKDLLRNGDAMGCFYVESPGMRMLMSKLQVDSYLGLVAASSIIRPGVAQSGMMREYILRHRIPEKRLEAHPILQKIMPETYGVMVYQEDVIKVAHIFAGLSFAEADILRRGMSGKFRSREEFHQVREVFFKNCREKGHAPELTSSVWKQIESFAGYAFSKGHSASYAVESYQSLYLKAYYPLEYMTATINNFGGYYRSEIYVHEAREKGAEVEAPCLNTGAYECILQGKKLILGFILVNSIERKTMEDILRERLRGGPFIDFNDLVNRVTIPLEQLTLIIRVGGLRSFPENRKSLLWKAHFYHNRATKKQSVPLLFEDLQQKVDFQLPELEESQLEQAFEEIELLGFPLCNPFNLLAKFPDEHQTNRDIPGYDGKNILTYGYLVALKQATTSKGEIMYFGTFLDREGKLLDTVHFPPSIQKFPFTGKGIYRMEGRVTNEFEYYTIEVERMQKMAYMEDVRYSDLEQKSELRKAVF